MEKLCATFTMFGSSHWVLVLFAAVIATALVLVLRKAEGKRKKYASWGIVGTMCGLVALEFVGLLASGGKFMESLPLSPINIFVYISLFVQIKESESWIKFGYFITVPLSVIGMFVAPNYLTMTGAWSISVMSYFVCCGLVVAYSVLQTMWFEDYLNKKDILNSFLNYVIIVAFVHIFNVILRFTTFAVHANYFGTMGEEYDVVNKLLYKFIEVPLVHQLPIFAILVGLGFLLIIPFDMFKTKKDRASQMEELVALGNLKAQQEYRNSRKLRGSQVLLNSTEKAKPSTPKNVTNRSSSGFVAVTKEVKVHKDEDKK